MYWIEDHIGLEILKIKSEYPCSYQKLTTYLQHCPFVAKLIKLDLPATCIYAVAFSPEIEDCFVSVCTEPVYVPPSQSVITELSVIFVCLFYCLISIDFF